MRTQGVSSGGSDLLERSSAGLNLKQIAESVIRHIRELPIKREFGIIEIKIQDGRPHQVTVTESKLAKDIR